jgi:DNA-binding NarL/FixJ family response regulator
VAEAASGAIAAGAALSAIADAERTGQLAIARAGRIGLSHRDIATAAEVSHGTVRAILARSSTSLNGSDQQTVTAAAAATDDGPS